MLKDKKYFFSSYNEESDLEKIVVEIAPDLFGEHSFIFPKSKLMSKKAELRTIPDGFVLDLSDPDNPILYVLEVELRSHGLEHIATQVLKFAIHIERASRDSMYSLKRLSEPTQILRKKIADRLTESKKFKYLDQLIDSAMDEDIPTVIIPIDDLDESLTQVQDYISVPIRYLPIETYVNPETGETLHHFKQLYQVEEAAKPTEVGIFYQFLLDDVEIIDIPRSKFDEEHGISKHAQGYTFVRDTNGEPVARAL